MTQVDGAGSLVRLKVIFDGDPRLARRLIGRHGGVEDGLGDGAIQLCANAAVVLGPSLINGFGSRGPVDVLEEPKLAAHGMEEGAPLGVVRRTKLQGYGDVSLPVDGRKGIDHVSHGRRRSSGGGAVTSDINRLDLLGRGGRSPGKRALTVVWLAPKVGHRGGGEAP